MYDRAGLTYEVTTKARIYRSRWNVAHFTMSSIFGKGIATPGTAGSVFIKNKVTHRVVWQQKIGGLNPGVVSGELMEEIEGDLENLSAQEFELKWKIHSQGPIGRIR